MKSIKYFLIVFFSLVFTVFAAQRITDDVLTIGQKTSTNNKVIEAEKGDGSQAELRFNVGSDKWELSTDGANYNDIATVLAETFPEGNYLINGNFDFWQRGTSFAGVSVGDYYADRWKYSSDSDAIVTISRSTDTPTFSESDYPSDYSLSMEVTTSDTNVTTQSSRFLQIIEGFNVVELARASSFTLSFWVKATVTGTYSVTFGNSAGNGAYVAEYTISSSNTWEKETITVPKVALGTGTWNKTNGSGMFVSFWIGGTGSATSSIGSWGAIANVPSTNQVNNLASNGNIFRLSQVMIEEGDEARTFTRAGKSIQRELELCQRYYEKSYELSTVPGTATSQGFAYRRVPAIPLNGIIGDWQHKVTKRTTPSYQIYDNTGSPNTPRVRVNESTVLNAAVTGTGVSGFSVRITGGSLSAGDSVDFHWVANAEL